MYKVPWRHHVEIISKCKNVDEAIFYLTETVKNNWSRSALEDVISAKRYEKMGKDFYVTAVDRLMKGKDDNSTIGLLICKDKDETKVEWSFDGINKPLGVASYELNIKTDDFKNSLPTIEEIESEIK